MWNPPKHRIGTKTVQICGYITEKEYAEAEEASKFAVRCGFTESSDKSTYVEFCMKFTTKRLFEIKDKLIDDEKLLDVMD